MAGMYGCFKGRNSDSAAMASGPPDVMANQEPAEVVEECSGKKKSKFQTFKKFFARKKRKEPPAAGDAGLKASQSIDNVSKTSENNTLTRSEKEKGSGSKINLGGKALSHDSVFVSDSSEANEALGASQDSIHGKVKSLQHQLRQAIRLGSPPSLICVKKTDDGGDGGAMSEDDSLPCSPTECTTPHTPMNQAQRNSSISLEGADSDDDQLSCPASSRTVSPLVVPGDFSLPASPFGCLDNSAAKHKLGLRHKACNKRKPVSRLDLKGEGDSVVEEILNTSTAEAPEEQEQQKIPEVVSNGYLKPKVDEEEEEEEEEEVEEEQPQHPRHSLSRDEEEREEAEERADPDVSQVPDSSSLPEQHLSEEEDSQPSSRASSLDSPGATLEPPAEPRENLLDPPGISYGAEEEKEVESDLVLSGEEDGVQESRVEEEESSFLQEVLSSLKTPLASCSLTTETEGVVLELEEEAKETEREEVWVQDVEEMKEEEPRTGSLLSDQTTEEEEEVATFCQNVEEEEDVQDQEAATSMYVSQHDREEEGEEEEVEKEDEENDVKTGNVVNQAEEEEGREVKTKDSEEEEEEEAIEQEVEEEGWEKREEEEVEETEEVEEAIEEETDNMEDVTGEEDAMQPPKEEEAAEAVFGDVSSQQQVNDDETESQDAAGQSFGEEKEEGEKEVEEGVEVERKSEQEEDREAAQPDADQSEHVQQEDGGTSHFNQSEATDQDKVPSRPPPLSLPESQCETQPQDSGPITPSKTSTTTIHINLLSPSSKKAPPFFQQSLNATRPEENQMPCCAVEQNTEQEEKEEAVDDVGAVEEEEEEGRRSAPPASIEVNHPTGGSAQSNTWLRSLSVGDAEEASNPPVSVPSSPSSVTEPASEEEEKEVVAEVKAESACPAKTEVVLSPSRVRRSVTPTTPSPSTIQPQASAAASTEESAVVSEGNPDNPFGVRLRKTSALQRFSSEEENTEPPIQSPTQPTSCRVDSLQPISVKTSINQPISNKPVIPKKPDVHGDSGGKNKHVSDPAAVRGVSVGSDSPSWISVAKQKQRIYKENSLDEITVRKEEPERKSSLPVYVSSAASRENSNRTSESPGKVSALEIRKSSAAAEKEVRRALSPPTPVPPQPPKLHLPTITTTAKPPSQPNSPQRSLSPPFPIPQKSPSCTSPPSPSKTPQSTTLTSPPFSSRPAPGKSGSRAPGLSSQTPASQRGLPPPALSQDEPPWMALAKKKAKAWSEMPQIVQ